MTRGGKRPGAGAPLGNHNALKTGRYSKRFQQIARALLKDPDTLALLATFRKKQIKQQRLAAGLADRELRRFILEVARAKNPLLAYTLDPSNNPILKQSRKSRQTPQTIRKNAGSPACINHPVKNKNNQFDAQPPPTL